MMVSNLPILLFCHPSICAISASLICFGSHFASSRDGFADNWYKYEVLAKARDQVFPSAKFTDPHGLQPGAWDSFMEHKLPYFEQSNIRFII